MSGIAALATAAVLLMQAFGDVVIIPAPEPRPALEQVLQPGACLGGAYPSIAGRCPEDQP